jgi:formylglycine-generating enzyme required for sulfatase activity
MRVFVTLVLSLLGGCFVSEMAWNPKGTLLPCSGDSCPAIEWVALEGGTFEMGLDQAERHRVTVEPFDLMQTEVTVAQYRACMEAGVCAGPTNNFDERWEVEPCLDLPNWARADAAWDHRPVNCLRRYDMERFAVWMNARLPTEAEWEFAATSGGLDRDFPWGNEPITCERVVHHRWEGVGCGSGGPLPVCTHPQGNSEQGICNLVGNISEMVADAYVATYDNAPTDGSAVLPTGDDDTQGWVVRGENFQTSMVREDDDTSDNFRVRRRRAGSGNMSWTVGFRLARKAAR